MKKRIVSPILLALLISELIVQGVLSPPLHTQEVQSSYLSLDALRAQLKATQDSTKLLAMLFQAMEKVTPSDFFTLAREFATTLSKEGKSKLAQRAAELAVLTLNFQDAAQYYEYQSTLLAETNQAQSMVALFLAARSRLAIGDIDIAAQHTKTIIGYVQDSQGKEVELGQKASLLQAWVLLHKSMQLDTKSASVQGQSLAEEIFANGINPTLQLEGGFLAWLGASEDRANSIAAELQIKFPHSIEARIIAGEAVLPPLPHWYLSALSDAIKSARAKKAAKSASMSSQKEQENSNSATLQAPVPSAKSKLNLPVRLQVGYFTKKENALRLVGELNKKRFSARLVSQPILEGQGKEAADRWVVIVEVQDSLTSTQTRLSESGYNSYPLD